MKNLTVTLGILLISLISFGQRNPVKDLTWQHWYDYPYNFYSLSWTVPDSSETDTLAGYNIYRDNVLWRYQPDIGFHCIPYDCPDPGFLLPEPFWIKVTAVYNFNHLESIADDSINDPGIAVGMEDKGNKPVTVLSNPVQRGEMINIQTQESLAGGMIELYNGLGTVVKRNSITGNNSILELDTSGLPAGFYYLVIRKDNFISGQKILIE